MKKRLFSFIWISLFCAMTVCAQKLVVESFTHVPNDLSAQTNERLDLNGKPCALLKISVMDDITNATGSVIGNVESKGVTKWIYTTSRAPQIKLEFQYHFPLTIKFADYGYQYLDGYQTYEVVLVDANASVQQTTVAQQPPVSSANGSAVAPSSSSFRSFTETVNGVSFTMIAVTGGTFTMGATSEQGSEASDDEKPAHRVTLSDYYIGETEVTQELWQAVMGSNPSRFTGNLQRPVEKVTWYDCQEFVNRLNQLTGLRFRLPTEAEWEYAARGGRKSRGYKYSGSNTIDAVAWYGLKSGKTTHSVKQKQPNELGLYDMSGNVYEWCSDWYDRKYYSSSSQTNPAGPSSGSNRVFRGGNWYDNARCCRVSNRCRITPTCRDSNLGFRLAL